VVDVREDDSHDALMVELRGAKAHAVERLSSTFGEPNRRKVKVTAWDKLGPSFGGSP
jgi:hypothetical protein